MNQEFSKNEQSSIFSPEAEEVIMQIPNGVQRWSITIVSLAVGSLLLISWFVKYPDLISAPVEISTIPPPIELVSRTNGKLHLLRAENSRVQKGEIVGYLESNASVAAVLLIEKVLNDKNDLIHLTLSGSLGDLQPTYARLITAITSLKAFDENRLAEKQIMQLEKELSTQRKIDESISQQEILLVQELKLIKEKFATDSVLFLQNVTAALDYNVSRTHWLQQQRSALNIRTAHLNNQALINQISSEISDLEIEQVLQRQRLELDFEQAMNQMLAEIYKWKQTYLFIAPDSGRLAYLGFLEDYQYIDANRPLFSILSDHQKLIAKGELPLFRSGKVEVGQSVNIRLSNYPFEQYGLLTGKISSIALMSGGDKYRITIELPNRLLTTQNKTLPYTDQLSGTTQIITDDLRLLERLFYTISKAFDSR